jgi:hypothetical protein
MMTAEGRDPEAPLAALARHGYSTYTVRGAIIEKSAILHHLSESLPATRK